MFLAWLEVSASYLQTVKGGNRPILLSFNYKLLCSIQALTLLMQASSLSLVSSRSPASEVKGEVLAVHDDDNVVRASCIGLIR